MNSDEPAQDKRPDRTASRARVTLVTGLALLAAGIVYSSMANPGWLTWLLARTWLATLAVAIFVLVAGLLFDISRPKNVAWRSLREHFGKDFGEILDRKNFATGRGEISDYTYLGLRCFGSPSGLEISRIMAFMNPPLYLPWSAIAKIDTFPNLLTGRKEFETDMQARINLRDQSEIMIEAPWLTEYRQFLPKSVKFRAIKLSKK